MACLFCRLIRAAPTLAFAMDTFNISILAIGAFSMLTNGVLLVILYLDPLKKFRTTTNYLIISLTFSDFVTGGVSCAFAFTYSPVTFGMFWTTILSSFFTIFFISCERLVVVMYPLKAKSLITERRVFTFIAADWLASAVLGSLVGILLPPVREHYLFVVVFILLALIIVLVGIYIAIILKMRRKPKLIRKSMRPDSLRNKMLHEKRLVGVLMLLVAILLITVVPYLATGLVMNGYRILGRTPIPESLAGFTKYYLLVELLNFAVNPIIYAWRLPSYRRSVVYYFGKLPFVKRTFNVEQGNVVELPTRISCQNDENTLQLLNT